MSAEGLQCWNLLSCRNQETLLCFVAVQRSTCRTLFLTLSGLEWVHSWIKQTLRLQNPSCREWEAGDKKDVMVHQLLGSSPPLLGGLLSLRPDALVTHGIWLSWMREDDKANTLVSGSKHHQHIQNSICVLAMVTTMTNWWGSWEKVEGLLQGVGYEQPTATMSLQYCWREIKWGGKEPGPTGLMGEIWRLWIVTTFPQTLTCLFIRMKDNRAGVC